MLRHPKTLLPFSPKYSLHSLVRSEELLVFRILDMPELSVRISSRLNDLQVLLLEVSPQLLDHLRSRHLQNRLNVKN